MTDYAVIPRPRTNLEGNLLRGEYADQEQTTTNSLEIFVGNHNLYDVGLRGGDLISCQMFTRSSDGASDGRFRFEFFDGNNVAVGTAYPSTSAQASVDTTISRTDIEVPANAKYFRIRFGRIGGSGSVTASKPMVSFGGSLATFEHAHTGPMFRNVSFGIERGDIANTSFTGGQALSANKKALWRASWNMPTLRGADLRVFSAWYNKLASFEHRFEIAPPEYSGPSTGYNGVNPLVNTAAQTGKTLLGDGLPADTYILATGDYIAFEADNELELHMVTGEVWSSGSGTVSIPIEPAIRRSPADDTRIQIFCPRTRMRLSEPATIWSFDMILDGELSVQAIETFWHP